ncbi:uncharacterized protein LOC132266837 [Cornus florida]|uniref:uncharacterized protein LOC132266837 n=1 Tax=Cornus florida TaxID=4283 RepID=UPI00289CCF64|nr:uncharacterized protein LOC132266837 [Cornus florida]
MSKWWRATAGGLRRAAESTRSYHTIQAIPREITGNRVSARDRAQGRIPAIVSSEKLVQINPSGCGLRTTVKEVSRKHFLTTEKKQIKAILKSVEPPFFFSTTFPLQIRAGSGSSILLESGKVLPVKIHRDKETGNILNLVFLWADDGTELKVDVPLVFKGEDDCPGFKNGGHLNKIRTSLKYLCPAEHIPQKIEVDISELQIGDRVFMHDIEVHPSLKLLSRDEKRPVCRIVEPKLESVEPELESVEPKLESSESAQ